MSNPLLSIVIPVYGVEDYIAQFLDSLFPQLGEEVECIFVDDGCLDQSMEIVNQKIVEFSGSEYVQVIHQENGGLSVARNTGISHASGKYITFLDSDDYVDPKYIQTILQAIKMQNFDILHFNAYRETKRHHFKVIALADAEQVVTIDQAYLESLAIKNHWYAWIRVFKRELLVNFRFPADLLIEDSLSFPYVYRKGLRVLEIPKSLVFYRYRIGSITRRKISDKLLMSYLAGVNQFRRNREDKYFCELYKNFIVYCLNYYRKVGYQEYCRFLEDYHSDIEFLRKNKILYSIKKKDEFMLFYPKLHFGIKMLGNYLLGKRYK